MLGRIFGRGKDEPDQAVCTECGRTLLAGEWTKKVIGADGEEKLMCSLCMQQHTASGEDQVEAGATPANSGRVRETRSESRDQQHHDSDTFWRALKDKDIEIERLEGLLARAESEKQELRMQVAQLTERAGDAGSGEPGYAEAEAGAAGSAAVPAPEPSSLTGDSSVPGERTWGETPAEFAAELAGLPKEPAPESSIFPAPETADVGFAAESFASAVSEGPVAPHVPAAEDTQPIDMLSEEAPAQADEAAEAPSESLPGEPELPGIAAAGPEPLPDVDVDDETTMTPEPVTAVDAEAEQAAAATMMLLQRGVDLLNISRVPRKIAETNEQLGLPQVNVDCENDVVAVTFMWSMGWYRFSVDSSGDEIRMSDRGYEELTGLQPNASVRADGTVQLAPAQIARAAAARAAAEPAAAAPEPAPPTRPAPGPDAGPESPRVAAQKPPEILSKSLLGQRSDDEAASWEKTQARDFEWDH